MAPRLRDDLVAATVDEQGVAYIEVTDPITTTGFRFYDFEYALAQQLTGQPLQAVVAWADQTYGLDLTREALDQFIEKLAALGFLAVEAPSLLEPPSASELVHEVSEGSVIGAPHQPAELIPRLQVLAGPLPPVSEPTDASRVLAEEALGSEVMAGRSRSDASPSGDTPLGAIAHAIVGETSGPPPSGALDAPVAAPSAASPGKSGRQSSESWVASLAHEVDRSQGERRQPPRPEVVILPPVAEPSAAVRVPRRRSSLWLVLLLVCAAGAGAAWFLRPATGPVVPPPSPSAVGVHVVTPQPTTFYRWFESAGVVVPGRNDTLAFSSAGRVQDVMPPGTTFAAGETVARLQGVVAREITVNRLRARVAFAEQLRDSNVAEGNRAAVHLAEAKLTARKQELAAAQAALAEWEIRPKVAGEIAQVLVQKGDFVKPGIAVFRIRAAGPRATFSLPDADLSRARALTFCRLETIPGSGGADGGVAESKTRAIDCSLSTGMPSEEKTRLALDLVGATSVLPGTEVRLASARYDGVFPVPASALAHEGGVDHLWVVSGAGSRAENRVVEVAATVGDLSLIAHGIGVGESIVVDPPAGLKTGGDLSILR